MSSMKGLRNVVEEYKAAGGPWPAEAKAIAAWAIANRRWEPSTTAAVSLCAHEISKAMREEYFTDPKGRRVRSKHQVTKMEDGHQVRLWDDMRGAARDHMLIAFQQRRNSIVADCRQLGTDVESFNEFGATEGRPIQIVFDFTNDVEEAA